MPTAFVTGGTGFVGLNLVRLLRERDWEVIAVHRQGSDVRTLADFGPELRVADVRDAEAVERAMPDGVDAVFHVAASTNLWRFGNAEQTRTNVDGTRIVVQAALTRGARRFIHTSSVVAYGDSLLSGTIHEDSPSNAATHWVNYVRTKKLAELEVSDGIAHGLDAVILNPANVLGPYDRQGWSRMFRLVRERRLPGCPPGSSPWCHVEEVATAHLAAFERGHCGHGYLLGGSDASYEEMIRVVAELCGAKAPRRLPAGLLRVVGRVAELFSYVTRKEPDVTPEKVFLTCAHSTVDDSKAQRELGYRAVPLRRMLEDTHTWLRAEGLA